MKLHNSLLQIFRAGCLWAAAVLVFACATPALAQREEQLSLALTDHDSRAHLAAATEALLEGQYYRALKALRILLPREARLLAASGS